MNEGNNTANYLRELRKTFFCKYSENTNRVLNDVMGNLAGVMDTDIPELEEAKKEYTELFYQIVSFLIRTNIDEIDEKLLKVERNKGTNVTISQVKKIVKNKNTIK